MTIVLCKEFQGMLNLKLGSAPKVRRDPVHGKLSELRINLIDLKYPRFFSACAASNSKFRTI
jgi:hypothetical protein